MDLYEEIKEHIENGKVPKEISEKYSKLLGRGRFGIPMTEKVMIKKKWKNIEELLLKERENLQHETRIVWEDEPTPQQREKILYEFCVEVRLPTALNIHEAEEVTLIQMDEEAKKKSNEMERKILREWIAIERQSRERKEISLTELKKIYGERLDRAKGKESQLDVANEVLKEYYPRGRPLYTAAQLTDAYRHRKQKF